MSFFFFSHSLSLSVSSFHLDAVDYEDIYVRLLLSGVCVWTYIVVVLLKYL